MSQPFFITALPRSGTTFLSNFLTYDGVLCLHEATCGCETMQDLWQKLHAPGYARVGTADATLPAYHRGIKRMFQDALWIGVEREPAEVMTSLLDDRVGLWPGGEAFGRMLEKHQEALLGCQIRVKFKDLFLTETLRNLWQNISDRPFDERRAAMLSQMRVEPDMRQYLPRYRSVAAKQMEAA